MVTFIPVRYKNIDYPSFITPKIQEITANFFNFLKHKDTIQKTDIPYLSLHTDPGYRGKKEMLLCPKLLHEFPIISKNVFDFGSRCVSKLWFNEKWSREFSCFLVKLTEGVDRKKIRIIEIHPPIDAYCGFLEAFLESYAAFEEEALKAFPFAVINIENRCNPNPRQKGGKFILSTNNDLIKLSDLISKFALKLKLVLDIPQLLSEHHGNKLLSGEAIKEILAPVRDIRKSITSTHIWGYNIDKQTPHDADFDIYFHHDPKVKECFLQEVCRLFDDGRARFFVPEVSKKQYLTSMVSDLGNVGIEFVEPQWDK